MILLGNVEVFVDKELILFSLNSLSTNHSCYYVTLANASAWKCLLPWYEHKRALYVKSFNFVIFSLFCGVFFGNVFVQKLTWQCFLKEVVFL